MPEGALIGQPFKLAPWQRTEIKRIYDNKAGTRRAILSFGRKNGKTTLAALLLIVHLCGPMAEAAPNSNLYSTAQSQQQAGILFRYAAKIIRMSPDLRDAVLIKDGMKELLCPGLMTHYRALSAEAKTAYGLSPSFIVHDELGQVKGPRSPLYEALETATGAHSTPLSVIISTQAPTDGDLLSILIDDALAGNDPRVICKLYTAPVGLDPFDSKTIRLANPAMGNFLIADEILAMAEDARRMPAREAEYRNLILNQRVEASSPFVKPAQWKACSGETADLTGCEVYGGLDLSEVNDLTAFVLIGKIDGIWYVKPTFWLPTEGLTARSKADRVPYDIWHGKGFLETTPGNSISYEVVAHRLKRMFGQHNVLKVGFDKWNMRHLRPWLIHAGFPEQTLDETFVEFAQDRKEMSPALRELESIILEKQLRHGDNPVMNMCAANAVVEGKDASNRKLSKKKSSGRIDGMTALAMAVGVAPLRTPAFDVSTLIA